MGVGRAENCRRRQAGQWAPSKPSRGLQESSHTGLGSCQEAAASLALWKAPPPCSPIPGAILFPGPEAILLFLGPKVIGSSHFFEGHFQFEYWVLHPRETGTAGPLAVGPCSSTGSSKPLRCSPVAGCTHPVSIVPGKGIRGPQGFFVFVF